MQGQLDELWDFSDAGGSERRLRAAVETAPNSIVAAELTTQVARSLGLQEKYVEADAVLDRVDSPDDFLTVDAAHMLAIADAARAPHWTARALETVGETTDARTKRWAVGLHNNLGWWLFDAGDRAAGLVELELAADAARDYGTAQQQVWAQEAIDEARVLISKLAD